MSDQRTLQNRGEKVREENNLGRITENIRKKKRIRGGGKRGGLTKTTLKSNKRSKLWISIAI